MNKLTLLFTGILLTFGSAWVGLVAYPVANLSNMQPLLRIELMVRKHTIL
jgi:hypothetical protein